MTGPNFWEVVRLALLMAALVVIVAFGLRADGRRRHPVMLAVWAAVPGAMLVATPAFAHRPRPPGARRADAGRRHGMRARAHAGFATRRLLEGGRSLAALARRRSSAGYALWLLGVYQKEASICALALFPFLYFVLDRRWRAEGVVDRAAVPVAGLPRRRSAARAAAASHDVRDHAGHRGRRDRVRHRRAARHQRMGHAAVGQRGDRSGSSRAKLGTFVWLGVAGAVPFLLLAWAFGHRRVPWLPLGLLAAGLAVYLFQGIWAGARRRATSSRSWRSLPPPPSSCSPTGRGGFSSPGWSWWRSSCGTTSTGRTSASRNGRTSRRTRIAAVDEVARLDPARCPVYMARFHAEDADAFPELVAREPRGRAQAVRPIDSRAS